MQQFHIQLPPTALFPEDSLEFFDTLDEVEDYAEYLLRDIFNGEEEPLEEGFLIYRGCEYVSAVVRIPSSGEIFIFREDESQSAHAECVDCEESHEDDIPF